MEKEKINAKRKSPFTDIFLKLIDGMTQQQVADKVGVSRQNVGLWIKGATVPDIFTLPKIATAFNVSTDYLLGRTETKSVEEDIQIACKVTGLSEKAINKIVEVREFSVLKEFVNSVISSFDVEWLENACHIRETIYVGMILSSSCVSAFIRDKHPELNENDYDSVFKSEKYSKEYYKFHRNFIKDIPQYYIMSERGEFEEFKYNKLFEKLRKSSIEEFDSSAFDYCKEFANKLVELYLNDTIKEKSKLREDIISDFHIESLKRCTTKMNIINEYAEVYANEIIDKKKAGD